MVLCKDCKWARPPYLLLDIFFPYWEGATCHAPQNHKPSLVTGECVWPLDYKYCGVHRQNPSSSKTCGSNAQWFQPKAPA